MRGPAVGRRKSYGVKVKDTEGLWEEELKRKKKFHLLSLEAYVLASECWK